MTRAHIPNAKLLNMLSSPETAEKPRERDGGLTNITPDGCPIHDIRIPHDRIHEPDERGKAAPEDEQARANVPARGFGEVPSERDRGRGKGEEREDGEHVVNSRHFRVLKQTTREERPVVSAERTIRLVCVFWITSEVDGSDSRWKSGSSWRNTKRAISTQCLRSR